VVVIGAATVLVAIVGAAVVLTVVDVADAGWRVVAFAITGTDVMVIVDCSSLDCEEAWAYWVIIFC
jgi:hypothetical protein